MTNRHKRVRIKKHDQGWAIIRSTGLDQEGWLPLGWYSHQSDAKKAATEFVWGFAAAASMVSPEEKCISTDTASDVYT